MFILNSLGFPQIPFQLEDGKNELLSCCRQEPGLIWTLSLPGLCVVTLQFEWT
jgi:hypothetical protein